MTLGEDSEIKILDPLSPNKVGPALRGRGVGGTLLMQQKPSMAKALLEISAFHHGGFGWKTHVSSVSQDSRLA